jgi:hypothetical protein
MKHILLTFFLLNSYYLAAMEDLRMIEVQLPSQKELRTRFYSCHFNDFEDDMWPSFKFGNKQENPLVIADQINNEFTLWIKEKHKADSSMMATINDRRKTLVLIMLIDHEQILKDMVKNGHFDKYLSK